MQGSDHHEGPVNTVVTLESCAFRDGFPKILLYALPLVSGSAIFSCGSDAVSVVMLFNMKGKKSA